MRSAHGKQAYFTTLAGSKNPRLLAFVDGNLIRTLILSKPTLYGLQISLNPERIEEIIKMIEDEMG